MKIGNVAVEQLAFLAPMRAVNCPSFRILCKQHGAGLLSTQTFWSWETDKWERRLDDEFAGNDAPLSVQVGGNQPEALKRSVGLLEARADVIDFNAGCPHADACGNKSGAFLLLHPNQLERAVAAVVSSTNKPVTAKIRTGWSPDKVNVVEVAKLLEGLGIAAITVHGRTRQQLFKGSADWGLIKAVKEAVHVPVVGNGDVSSGRDAGRMMAETGCDAVMVGRAARGNPFIFRQVNDWLDRRVDTHRTVGQSIEDFRAFARSYHAIEHDRSLTEFKDQATWFLKGLRGIKGLLVQVRGSQDIPSVERAIDSFSAAVRSG
ncbi:MAG: tRNA-dihydrouridine synthase family protein [Candidatus Lokiarchaeota archaeon]|nr:tRNA-dihydrouridine synthase family protein [Candidatus Lokiarchaeota archaeon]